MIGLRVGPFEISGDAEVPVDGTWYTAFRTGNSRRRPHHVLVKLLPPQATQAERTRLQATFETIRSLEDSRIPKAVSYYEGNGAMVLGAVRGIAWTRLVDGRASGAVPMTPATLCDLGLDLAECLQHIHLRGSFHGHLHPELLWLAEDGRLWVWGIGDRATPPMAWRAPELARSEPSGPLTDQWCLGALLAALVTGRHPWADDAAAEQGHLEPWIDEVEVQWPALGRLVRRMLDPEPSRRFPDLGPVRAELLALSRKAKGLSERRELAVSLAAEAPPSPVDALTVQDGPVVPSQPATEDEITVRQPPMPDAEVPEALSREEPVGRLAKPGTLVTEAIPVVAPEVPEDLPDAAIPSPPPPETPMSADPGTPNESDESAPPEQDAAREPTAAEPYGGDDPDAEDEESATEVRPNAAAAAPSPELPFEYGEKDEDEPVGEEDATRVFTGALKSPGDEEDEEAPTNQLKKEPPAAAPPSAPGVPTNPTAVPWTDPGPATAVDTPAASPEPAPAAESGEDKVLLPEDGVLPTPVEPRPMPRNQQIALGMVALMILLAVVFFVTRL